MVMGEAVDSSAVMLIRNRWPSGATAYCCLQQLWSPRPRSASGITPPGRRLQRLTGSLNRRCHQLAVRGDVEQFLAVAAPPRLRCRRRSRPATCRRDPETAAHRPRYCPDSLDSYATHRPSGENWPFRSSKLVFTNGNGLRSPNSGSTQRSSAGLWINL